MQCSAQRSADTQILEERSGRLAQAFAKIEKELGDGPFFNGTTLSDIDIAWLPLLHRAYIIQTHTGYDFLVGFSKVKVWQGAILNTGLAEKSVPDDFEQRFTDFYLSENTYLGSGTTSTNNQDKPCFSGSCC